MARMTRVALIVVIIFLLSFVILAKTTKGTIGFLENIELPGLFGFGAKKAQVHVFKIASSAPVPSPRYVYKINQTAKLKAEKKEKQKKIKNEIDKIKKDLRQEYRLKAQRKEKIKLKIDKIKKDLRQEQRTAETCKQKVIELKKSLTLELQKEKKIDNFDFFIGVGSYGSNAYNLNGDYIWAKIRYNPFEFLNDKLELGFFGFGALGIGSSKNLRHAAVKLVIGPSLKINFSDWTAGLDFGIGKLSNEIHAGSYQTKQIDDLFVLSGYFDFHGRRNEKKKWLSKTSFGFDVNLPYSTSCKGCLHEYNNQVASVWFKQAIYDFEPIQNLFLTPEFNLGFRKEYEQGSKILKLGPSVTMSYYGQNILSFSFLNYERSLEEGNSDIHWLGGWLSIGGIVRAIKASRIKLATNGDLEKRLASR
ncbi:MAG: hypothetical protein U9P90_02570 [Patescibacteria group bacterium]|nr:hypothetical protein [Patescibacteria group bacterium]